MNRTKARPSGRLRTRVSQIGMALLLAMSAAQLHARQINGFELGDALIPEAEIFSGGPAKDGIPAIDKPQFVGAAQAQGLEDSDYVMGLSLYGISKAYPIRILNWHEIVNDTLGATSVVITFCPLCGSGMVFERQYGTRTLTFGVSGLLYNSDVLLYDRQTESLWSQIESRAVTGEYRGQRLTQIPVEHTTWADWRTRHPDTQVLDLDTGFARDYARDPYAGYAESPQTFFPVQFRAAGLHPKERVIGLVLDGKARAWPLVELAKSTGPLQDTLGNTPVVVHYNPAHGSARIEDRHGNLLAAVTLYWFAWAAFHPDTELFRQAPE